MFTKREWIECRNLSLALCILPIRLQPARLALSPTLLPQGPLLLAKLISQACFAHSFFVPEFTPFHLSGLLFPAPTSPSFKTLLMSEFHVGASLSTHLSKHLFFLGAPVAFSVFISPGFYTQPGVIL